jgi:lysophospholipase L1-like esterase
MPRRAFGSARTGFARIGSRHPGKHRAALAGGGALAAVLGATALATAGGMANAATTPHGQAPAKPSANTGVSDTGHHAHPVYYLALGDSLAQGVQPATPPLASGVTLGESIETDAGYANDLYTRYARAFHGALQLVKLGCPGETTTSMLTGTGSPCTYPQGSQLAAALAFIKAHRGEIKLITIDIGANNVDGCVTGGAISQTCVAAGIGALSRDMPLILGALRDAAGPHTAIAGMNLYDPFLADYLTGSAGQAAATESVSLDGEINQLITASDQAFDVKTADVATAFKTTDFTDTATLPGPSGPITVPLNVAEICDLTWMCAPAPVGPNIHANAAGYEVIASAFEQAIGELPARDDHR